MMEGDDICWDGCYYRQEVPPWDAEKRNNRELEEIWFGGCGLILDWAKLTFLFVLFLEKEKEREGGGGDEGERES